MSFAKDDIGLSNVQSLTQASTIKTRIVKDSSDSEVTETENIENQEKVAFSENLDKRLSGSTDSLNEKQESMTKLDIINTSFSSVSDTISDMEEQLNAVINNESSDENYEELTDSIKDKFEDIEKTIKNTTFDGKGLIEEKLNLPETQNLQISNKEDAKALKENLDKVKEDIIKRRASVSNSQNEIEKNMKDLFLTEINLLKDNEENSNSVEQVKNNVISGILDNPDKSVNVQVKSIDTDILIALIKIHA